jgi:formylglycine-generating enzyme required for sulfatase activity
MVILPSGTSRVGKIETDPNPPRLWHNMGLPPTKVTIAYRLALGKYEVTRREWAPCVDDNVCTALKPTYTGYYVVKMPLTDTHPAIASRREAEVYLGWLSKRTKRKYRLPSEFEWEFGARGGTSTEFWYGPSFDPSKQNSTLSMADVKSLRDEPRPAQVGRFAPNQYGLYDVYGNVAEWVADCYVITFREKLFDQDKSWGGARLLSTHPTDGSPFIDREACLASGGTLNGTNKKFVKYVLRGGASPRLNLSPNSFDREGEDQDVRHGFRAAVTLEE